MKEIRLEELKKIQLQILKTVASFCDQNKISYFLTGGTLIGAIRHHGYIPWDDDIDIIMPRRDYSRFLRSFHDHAGGKIKVISSESDDNYPYTFAKAINTATILEEKSDIVYPVGVYIDIFPLDNLPNSCLLRKLLIFRTSFYRKILQVKKIKNSGERSLRKQIELKILKVPAGLFDYRFLVRKIELLSQKYKNKEDTDSAAVLVLLTYGSRREIMEKSFYSTRIDKKFENLEFHVPVGYDKILTRMYGDYRKLPPKEKQVSHHQFKAYWKEGFR